VSPVQVYPPYWQSQKVIPVSVWLEEKKTPIVAASTIKTIKTPVPVDEDEDGAPNDLIRQLKKSPIYRR
jgi:hypothetical protein